MLKLEKAALSRPLGAQSWGPQEVKNSCDFSLISLIFIRMVYEDYLEMNMFFQQKVSF